MVAKPIALDFTRDLSPAIKKNDWVYNNNNLIFVTFLKLLILS